MSKKYSNDKNVVTISSPLSMRHFNKGMTEAPERGLGFTLRSLIMSLFVLLVIACIISLYSGDGNIPTFGGLLSALEDVPTVSFVDTFNDLTIRSSWGAFNFLRNFFNWFTSMLSIGTWLAQSFINLLVYAFYFVKYVFAF